MDTIITYYIWIRLIQTHFNQAIAPYWIWIRLISTHFNSRGSVLCIKSSLKFEVSAGWCKIKVSSFLFFFPLLLSLFMLFSSFLINRPFASQSFHEFIVGCMPLTSANCALIMCVSSTHPRASQTGRQRMRSFRHCIILSSSNLSLCPK